MQSTENMTKEERQEYWEMVIDEFSESDLTKTEYCKNNEIPISTFNYWDNRLKDLKADQAGSRFVELKVSDGNPGPFQITAADDTFCPEIGIDYQGLRILLTSRTPMPLLSSVLGELGYA